MISSLLLVLLMVGSAYLVAYLARTDSAPLDLPDWLLKFWCILFTASGLIFLWEEMT